MNAPPLILSITSNEQLAETVAQRLKSTPFTVETIRTLASLAPQKSVAKNRPGEPVRGADGSVYAALVERQPALILFDFDQEEIPWQKWVPIIKGSPATRRIPVIGYTTQFNAERQKEAKEHGLDLLKAQGQFLANLSTLVQEMARTADTEAIANACAQPLDAYAIKGLELFNQGEYFDAHEELEHAWKADQTIGRDLYRSVLQIAVAYLQIERGNYNGAIKMLQRVKQWIAPLPDRCRGINVGQLKKDATAVYEELQRLGRDRLNEFDKSLLKPVDYTVDG